MKDLIPRGFETHHVFSSLLSAALMVSACSSSSNHRDADDTLDDEGASAGGADPVGRTESGTSAALTVRCFDYGDDQIVCFGTPGTDNWAVAWPECDIAAYETDPELEPAGSPAAASCDGMPGAPDSLTGWDDVACFRHVPSGFVECYGKLGEYWLEIIPDCIGANESKTSYVGDPAQIFCGAASVDRGGWDQLRCSDPAADPTSPRCYGRRGAYWVGPTSLAHYANGLFPTCELGQDGTAVEVSPDRAGCPADDRL